MLSNLQIDFIPPVLTQWSKQLLINATTLSDGFQCIIDDKINKPVDEWGMIKKCEVLTNGLDRITAGLHYSSNG